MISSLLFRHRFPPAPGVYGAFGLTGWCRPSTCGFDSRAALSGASWRGSVTPRSWVAPTSDNYAIGASSAGSVHEPILARMGVLQGDSRITNRGAHPLDGGFESRSCVFQEAW